MPKFARPNSYNGRQATPNWTGDSRFATTGEAIDGSSNQLAISPATLFAAASTFIGNVIQTGTATLSSGTIAVADTDILATDMVIAIHQDDNSSSAVGVLQVIISAGVGFTINSLDATGSVETDDGSDVGYVIIRGI